MQEDLRGKLDALVRSRMERGAPQIRHSLTQIASGNPLAAEPKLERAIERIEAKTGWPRADAERKAAELRVVTPSAEARAARDGREAVWGDTLDFLDANYFELGRAAADTVGRIAFRDDQKRAQGSGFLIAPGLILTNHHVIGSAQDADRFCLQMHYETAIGGGVRPVTTFAFAPEQCFVSDGVDGLDFTLIAVGLRLSGSNEIAQFGYAPISDAADKHMLGEVANIIQHPSGRLKEIVLHENQLVGRDELASVLHYIADTEPGSSGSPVFNNGWEAIALHHWGGPWLELGRNRQINEGIRISAIVEFLKALAPPTTPAKFIARAREAIELGVNRRPQRVAINNEAETTMFERSNRPQRTRRTEDFSDRGGYEPGFLRKHIIPLPELPRGHAAAKNREARASDDPHELQYHHFSIAVNAERRLAYFTACNIDGARVVHVDRTNKTVNPDPTLSSMDLESFDPEASDAFRPDPRIDIDEQMARPFYEEQRVKGFPDPKSSGRMARMFQKGHIIMRGDPAWGGEEEAVAAERDTFFYTNAAPQIGYFNQGSRLDRPGSKGKLRWRAVETYVLRNAFTMRERVSVFAGPIFSPKDPVYRFDAQVPMRFWKIACWVDEDDVLRSIALIADQAEVLTTMPEAAESAEAFLDDEEIARVSQFLTTVEYIESQTKLSFGDAVRAADVRAGAEHLSVTDFKRDMLAAPRSTKKRKAATTAPAAKKAVKRARKR